MSKWDFILFHCSSNFILGLAPIYFNDEARLLSDVAEGLLLSADNPLDFNAEI